MIFMINMEFLNLIMKSIIAFDGSANETLNGLLYKSETIPVYRSWFNEELE